jgi:hypothetical protein
MNGKDAVLEQDEPVLSPAFEPISTVANDGIERTTTSLPLEEILRVTKGMSGQPNLDEADQERIQNRRFIWKVVFVCALAIVLILAGVLWYINGGSR